MSTMMSQGVAPTGTFVPQDLFQKLGNLSKAEADSYNFGIMQLDDSGVCHLVNQYQCDLAGLTPANYDGKHWFTKVAPCTNNSIIYGNFKKGVAANNLNLMLPYTFTFKMKPTNVKLHLFRDNNTGKNWVFCAKA